MSALGTSDDRAPARSRRFGRRARLRGAAAVAVALFTVAAYSGTAEAKGGGPAAPKVIADGLAGPLSIDVTGRGDVLVGQSFGGTVSSISKKGEVRDLVTEPGAEAVADVAFGAFAYTVTNEEGAFLKVHLPWGGNTVLADLGAYEAANNPDAGVSYGVPDITPECAAQWPVEQFGPPTSTGIVDAHPYKLAVGDFGVYVADAGANAILHVDWFGHVRTVGVMPRQAVVLPPDPSVMGLPQCVAGLTYYFDPVPTDIELDGRSAYVSLLPGGPEDDSLGARGAVVKLNLRTGATTPVVGQLAGATDLALAPNGDLYVTELFGGKVTKVSKKGVRSTVAELPAPAAVEWANGRLYVAYDAFGSGKVGTL